MLFRDLMTFATRLFENKTAESLTNGPRITARLVWRDINGTVVSERNVDCRPAHTKPEIVVEMGLYQGTGYGS
jgi:hypothetical protein